MLFCGCTDIQGEVSHGARVGLLLVGQAANFTP